MINHVHERKWLLAFKLQLTEENSLKVQENFKELRRMNGYITTSCDSNGYVPEGIV